MPFCLQSQSAEKIKQAILSGKLNPDKLNKMTSAERRKFLSGIVGRENAKEVNLLFERKLLLKNQEKAMTDWVRQITGMSKEAREKTLEKIRQTYLEKKRRLESPKENEKFLNEIVSDVYSKKYKTDISLDEAQTITSLSAEVIKNRAKMNPNFTWKSKADGINYGASKVAFNNYVGALKTEAQKRSFMLPTTPAKILEDVSIATDLIASNARAIVASVDNSFWGRQGLKVMFDVRFTKQWAKNFAKSFKDVYQVLRYGTKKGNAIVDATKAEIHSRKNALNGRYELGKKLDVGVKEEEFPTSLPSKIPIIGRIFGAAETAYEAGAMRLRADVADAMYKMAEKVGKNLEDKVETGTINQLVNSITGRGALPIGEKWQAAANKAFFSVKFWKSNYDILVSPIKLAADPKSFAKQQAAKNLLSVISVMGSVLGIAKAINPNSVDFDPRSANFCKIKVGNTRFDVSGGICSNVIAASRVVSNSTKSSVTGKVSTLGEGFGSSDGMDVLFDFTQNKFSPMFSTLKDFIRRETFEGDEATLLREAQKLVTPIIVQEGIGAIKDEKSANLFLILIADALGFGANTYGVRTNWAQSTSKEMKQFKEKVGDKEFKKANDKFNKRIIDWFSNVENTDKYKNLSDDDKSRLITNNKSETKKKLFIEYDFWYQKEPSKDLPKF